jgi:hypothetical protein
MGVVGICRIGAGKGMRRKTMLVVGFEHVRIDMKMLVGP